MSLPLLSPHTRREKEWMCEPSLFSSSLGHQPTPLAVTMKRYRGGFRLGRRLVRIWRRVFRLEGGYHRRPGPAPSSAISNARRRIESSAVATRLFDWGRSLSRRLRRRSEDLAPLLEEDAWGPPPKGHLAVYVGGGQPRRYVVPVIYFNHPLFGELLREAEEEFGFQHPGGITIPCPAAKFERVRTRIAAAGCHLRRKSSSSSRFLPL